MPLIPRLIQQRRRRRSRTGRSPGRAGGLGFSLLFSLLLVACSGALALFYIDLTRALPSPAELPLLLDPPHGALLQPTRLLDRTGAHILLTLEDPAARRPAGEGRLYLPLDPGASGAAERLPETLARAAVAAADPGFWNHPGFTLSGLGQGVHPTLAQRLVSDLLLWDESPGLRKDLRERLLAAQVTARYGREKVLEWYLNSAQFGRLIYGAEAAARAYFDKPASSLSLAEAALLAAAAEAPELDPLQAPQVPLERQKEILRSMARLGMVTEAQGLKASQESLRFRERTAQEAGPAPAFTSLALEQLSTRFSAGRLERGGLSLRTSLDYDLQLQASCAASAQLERAAGVPSGEDGASCEAARLLPTLPLPGEALTDSLAAQVIVLEPLSGQILAMVGDTTPGLDPAHLPGHPPGTVLSPFIYLSAFTRGWSPGTLAWDIPNQPASLPAIQPAPVAEASAQNGSDPAARAALETYHGPVSLRAALANDYQAPALDLLAQIGPEHVWRMGQQLGLASLDLPALQQALTGQQLLSGGEVTLLELGQAFGAFANQGILAGHVLEQNGAARELPSIQPVTMLRVEDAYHQVWLDCQNQPRNCTPLVRPVVSPQLAYLVTHVLSDETARWPSLKHPNPLEIGRPAAAKIGQTGSEGQAWTVGFTPQLVVGVWVGAAQEARLLNPAGDETAVVPASAALKYTSGRAAGSASALWHAVIQYASRSQTPQNWVTPAGISVQSVCEPSGMLPTRLCPSVVSEVFLTGTEPTYPDTLYRAYQVNRETGRLATVFTSPELIEEQVYLVVPPEAQDWARAAGLPMPPGAYDVVSLAPSPSPSVQIASPGMFAYVSGVVRLAGTAAGEDFRFYRLQAGKGLNPQEWLQIGADSSSSVREGTLGEWDTRGLDGLYALQLLVIREDQRIETAILQVTVDNQAPQVTILQPEGGRVFPGPSGREDPTGIAFEAQAEDDLGLALVEFMVDGEWLAALKEPPFVIAWKASPGKHILRIRVVDLAGNEAEAQKEFEVVE